MLTLHERARVRAALSKAAAQGKDPVQLLEQQGLLWSKQREMRVRADAVDEAASVLGQLTPAQVVQGRVPGSVLDMKREVVLWLSRVAVAWQKGESQT